MINRRSDKLNGLRKTHHRQADPGRRPRYQPLTSRGVRGGRAAAYTIPSYEAWGTTARILGAATGKAVPLDDYGHSDLADAESHAKCLRDAIPALPRRVDEPVLHRRRKPMHALGHDAGLAASRRCPPPVQQQ